MEMARNIEDWPEAPEETRLCGDPKKRAAESLLSILGRDQQPGDDAEALRRSSGGCACQGHHNLGTAPLKRDVSDDVSP